MVRAGSALLMVGAVLGGCRTPTNPGQPSLHCRLEEVETADAKQVWRDGDEPPFVLPVCLDVFGERAEVKYLQMDESLRVSGTMDRTGAFRPDAPSPYATIDAFAWNTTAGSAAVRARRSPPERAVTDEGPVEDWRLTYACVEGTRSDTRCATGCCYNSEKPLPPR